MIDTDIKPISSKTCASNAEIGNSIDTLSQIHQASKSIAIYKRGVGPLKDEVSDLLNSNVEFRSTGTIEHIEGQLKQALSTGDHQQIVGDIMDLLRCFHGLVEEQEYRVLLATIDNNMCRKFHTDVNNLRLLCTYSGPGTQWLSDETTSMSVFQQHLNNDEIELDEHLINQVDAGDVIILKGALHPDGAPIVHRSPTIEHTGQKRLLLRVDLNTSPWS